MHLLQLIICKNNAVVLCNNDTHTKQRHSSRILETILFFASVLYTQDWL